MTSSVCFLLLVIADTTITKSERHRRSLGGCDVNHERIFYAIATWNYAMSGFIFVPTQPGHSEPNGGWQFAMGNTEFTEETLIRMG